MIIKRRFRPVHCQFMKYWNNLPWCFPTNRLSCCQPVLWSCFFNACLCFDVEFQTAFFPSVSSLTVPLWRWCHSTLCLRLDTSPSVSLKRRKTFIRYKNLSPRCSHRNDRQRLMKVHFIHSSLLVLILHQKPPGISFWWHYLPSHNVIFPVVCHISFCKFILTLSTHKLLSTPYEVINGDSLFFLPINFSTFFYTYSEKHAEDVLLADHPSNS